MLNRERISSNQPQRLYCCVTSYHGDYTVKAKITSQLLEHPQIILLAVFLVLLLTVGAVGEVAAVPAEPQGCENMAENPVKVFYC